MTFDRFKVWLSLDIVGFQDDPDDITRILAIEPSRISRIGQKVGVSGHVRQNTWTVRSAPIETYDLTECIDAFLEKMVDRLPAVKSLSERCRVSFYVFVHAISDIPPIVLSNKSACLCSAAGATIAIEVNAHLSRHDGATWSDEEERTMLSKSTSTE